MAAALTLDQDVWRPKYNPWLIAVVVALAAFMEVLDTSIANVALPYMAGNLGASNDQSTWVLTSYLVSNAIILPISGWLAGALGRKRFFMACLTVFTVSSLLCGIAPSLGFSSFFPGAAGRGWRRVAADGAGHFGGYLSPAPARPGLCAVWHHGHHGAHHRAHPGRLDHLQLFLAVDLLHQSAGRRDYMVSGAAFCRRSPYLRKLKAAGVKLDYIGIALLALGIGALQVLLDKGQEDDWFGSHFITTLVVIATVCLISLVIWEWYQKAPIIDVRMFKSFNFASSSLMMFTLGILLFSSLVLMPQFLQTLVGYTSELAGLALSAGGLVLLIEMPIMGQLTTKIQARYLIAFGWLALSVAMFYSTKRIDLQISFSAATWLRIAQVIGLGFLFVPDYAGGLHWYCAGEK